MRLYDRRTFLELLSAAGVGLARRTPASSAVPRVDAEATIFYAQPDGQRALIRFFVSGADAPGGRLRVFDRGRRQVGTAGMVPVGDGRLYGELWMPLGGPERIESELLLPGERPLRSAHALAPKPRWVLYWTTIVPPDELAARLDAALPFQRAAQVALWIESGVTLNPVPASDEARLIDHLPFLRLTVLARRVEHELGVPLSRIALVPGELLDVPTLALVLRGAGVAYAATAGEAAAEPQWLASPDGSRVLLAPRYLESRPRELGFSGGGAERLQRVERWLSLLEGAGLREPVALIAGDSVDDATPAIMGSVTEWNNRYAFPRIVVGGTGEWLRTLERRAAHQVRASVAAPDAVPSSASRLEALARARAHERERRARAIAEAAGGLDAIAARLEAPVPGLLVFNPSPFTRSGLVRFADDTERVVTDVPALGYAYVPQARDDRGRWRVIDHGRRDVLENSHFRLDIHPETGAVRSLVSLPDGTAWVRAESPGLNAVPGARLEQITRQELSGAATRLVLMRWAPGVGAFRSSVTIYDSLPWVDIENIAEAVGDRPPEYAFSLAMDGLRVAWEVPGGVQRAQAPAGPFATLRWIQLAGAGGSMLVSPPDCPFARVTASGELSTPGPRGAARYRLAVRPLSSFPPGDDAWRFGWSIDPFLTATVNRRGSAQLPSFGSLLEHEEPGVMIIGVEPGPDGDGVVVYLQEVLGISRQLRLRGGVLQFADARHADLLGAAGASLARDGARADAVVSVPALGAVAVTLHGVSVGRT